MSSAGRGFKGWSQEDILNASQKGWDWTKGTEGKSRSGKEVPPAQDEEENESLHLKSKLVEQVEEEARKAGYEAGYAEGLSQARKEMAPLREAWLSWSEQIPRFESVRLQSILPDLVSLLSKAFERVLGQERVNPESIRALLERMVGEYASGREAELRIPEGDFHLLTDFDPDFSQELAARGVTLSVGGDLDPGQVELRFPDRIVSFDPGTAVDSFRRTLHRTNPGPVPRGTSLEEKEEGHEDRD